MIGSSQLDESAQRSMPDGVSTVVQYFVDAIKHLPELYLVALENVPPHARLWVVISAPPFESGFRDQIYEAYVAALSLMRQPGLTLRLINIREFEDDVRDILPPTYRVLYRRDAAA